MLAAAAARAIAHGLTSARRPCTLVVQRSFVHRPLRHSVTLTRRSGPLAGLVQRRHQSADTSSSPPDFLLQRRPDLVYRLCEPPTPASKTLPAYALSFETDRPRASSPATDIGWLTPHDGVFVPNPTFLHLLHGVIKATLEEGIDDILKAGAIQIMDGWMHINDQRNIPALNRIGDPEDIIGTVFVENSKIIPETYQPMPAYRLLSTDFGFMQLTPALTKKLKETLCDIAEIERLVARGR